MENVGEVLFASNYITNSVNYVWSLRITSINSNIIRINNNEFTGNNGGGFTIATRGSVEVQNNIISNNGSGWNGSGCASIRADNRILFHNNYVAFNEANDVGGVQIGGYGGNSENYEVIFSNNVITGNSAIDEIGGVLIYAGSRANKIKVFNNIISNNRSGRIGALAIIQSGNQYDEATIINLNNNTIYKNTTTIEEARGGGLYVSTETDNTIVNIYNNISFGNILNSSNIGADIYLVNDIDNNFIPSQINLYNNNFDQSPSGTYVQSPFPIDPSNLNNVDPLFVDSANGDYHLNASSQCIDAGNNAAPELPDLDKDGNPRVMNGIVDIGAYEYPGAALPIIDSFVAFPTSGEAPLPVTLTCVAHDFGGSIETYTLYYGDGISQINYNGVFNHEYVTTGAFDANCTAVDNDGESATSDPVTIAVTSHVNLPPVADCGQERAVVFNEVSLYGTGSSRSRWIYIIL